jgi:hypothetical protein
MIDKPRFWMCDDSEVMDEVERGDPYARYVSLEDYKAAVEALQRVWYRGDVDWAGNYLRDTDQIQDPDEEEEEDA